MVLRPVELDAAGDPGARKPYQGRLYYMIIVYKIVTVCLVISPLDAPTQSGKNHHFQVFVFQEERLILLVCFGIADAALLIFAFLRPWFFQIASILLQTIKPLNRINCCLI